MKGLGLSKKDGDRGDQYVKIDIVVPKETNERELALYGELAQISGENMAGINFKGTRR